MTSTSTTTTASTRRTAPYRWAADSREANAIDCDCRPTYQIRGRHRSWWEIPHGLAVVELLAIDNENEQREPHEGAQPWRQGWAWLTIPRRCIYTGYWRPSAADLEKIATDWLQDQADLPDSERAQVPDTLALYLNLPTLPDAIPGTYNRGRLHYFGIYEPNGTRSEYGDDLTSCDDCGETVWADATETVNGGDRVGNYSACGCLDHYVWCSDCETYYPDHDQGAIIGEEYVCSDCLDRGNYYYHDGEGWSTEPPESDDDDDDEHQGPDGMRRYPYHTDANDTLNHTIPDTGHTYGAELEYKGSPSDWQQVADACHQRAILTNDSTVSGELVSIAHTAGPIRRWLSTTAAALAGTHNDKNTGLHIHTDRRALTPWQWFTLAHYCAQHAPTLEAIAGRPSNQWTNLQSLPAPDWPTFARSWKSRCWPTRYAGLNFSKGPTVEWRICRATKTPARALARFGMVQRMIALGRLTPSQRPQSAAELRGWLAQDRYIQQVTGWEPGAFNYRNAMQQVEQQGDQPPAPPSVEQIQQVRLTLSRLEAEQRLTEQLRYNAWRQYTDSPYGASSPYTRDAESRWEHYRRQCDQVSARLNQARRDLDGLETLAAYS